MLHMIMILITFSLYQIIDPFNSAKVLSKKVVTVQFLKINASAGTATIKELSSGEVTVQPVTKRCVGYNYVKFHKSYKLTKVVEVKEKKKMVRYENVYGAICPNA